MARAQKKKYAMIVLDGTVILPDMTVQLEFPKDSGLVGVVEEAMKKNGYINSQRSKVKGEWQLL